MADKICKYCGQKKDVSEYRKYYQNSYKDKDASYPYCSTCEKIEMRRKYLLRMGMDNTDEYAMIIALYDRRLEHGLEVPRSYKNPSVDVSALIHDELDRLNKEVIE